MCNIICGNAKCDKRQANGCCGRAYPCSEYQALDILTDFNRNIISDFIVQGYDVTQVHDEYTIDIPSDYKR